MLCVPPPGEHHFLNVYNNNYKAAVKDIILLADADAVAVAGCNLARRLHLLRTAENDSSLVHNTKEDEQFYTSPLTSDLYLENPTLVV